MGLTLCPFNELRAGRLRTNGQRPHHLSFEAAVRRLPLVKPVLNLLKYLGEETSSKGIGHLI